MLRLLLLLLVALLALLGRYPDLQGVADILGNLANLLIIVAAVEYALGLIPRTIEVPIAFEKTEVDGKIVENFARPVEIGKLKIRRMDINASSLTNAVSTAFFGGGHLPDPTRKAIIAITNPKVLGEERIPVAPTTAAAAAAAQRGH